MVERIAIVIGKFFDYFVNLYTADDWVVSNWNNFDEESLNEHENIVPWRNCFFLNTKLRWLGWASVDFSTSPNMQNGATNLSSNAIDYSITIRPNMLHKWVSAYSWFSLIQIWFHWFSSVFFFLHSSLFAQFFLLLQIRCWSRGFFIDLLSLLISVMAKITTLY